MVVNVGAFASEEIKTELCRLARIREQALKLAYAIPGYEEMQREQRNRIYDEIRNSLM